jgi:aspartyl-tRNA(Asn)/glutamyl-tRNA(Gln) amidotransferase subunit A
MDSYATITQLAGALQAGEIGPVELTEGVLERIETLNPTLGAYLCLTRERALREAAAAQESIRSGDYRGPLHGIPYAAKDLFDVSTVATTAGTSHLSANIAEKDCAVVERLSKAGMVLLGKTVTCQLATDIIGLNFDQGTPHNPWHRVAHVPGGSSCGSGVCVAAGMAPMALGSDTGGSVRAPAAHCGVVGLKTTVGRVSRQGVWPESTTLDSVGPLTRSVEDAALVYQAIHGPDPADPTTLDLARHDVLSRLKAGVRDMNIAFAEGALFEEVHPEVESAVREAGEALTSLGACLIRVELPEFASVLSLEPEPWRCISAETYACHQALLEEHGKSLDPMVQPAMKGKHVLAVDYYRVLRKLADLQARTVDRLREVDVVLAPTMALPPVPVEEAAENDESIAKYAKVYVRNTSVGNLLRLCAVSVPCGFSSDGLPIGMMIYAKGFDEAKALRVAYAYEQATHWHRSSPDLSWIA